MEDTKFVALMAPSKWVDDYCNRPHAIPELTSYRYKGSYGWILIGAKDIAGALREASRSTNAPVEIHRLQVWKGTAYESVCAGLE